MNLNLDKNYAVTLDKSDKLSTMRDKFFIPQIKHMQEKIYFCGNSLGLQPKKASYYLTKELDNWKDLGVEGFFAREANWVYYHDKFKDGLSRLIGCSHSEVTVMNSLTVNLHLMLATFYKKHTKIIMLETAFPSDRFAVSSFLKTHGMDPDEFLIYISPDDDGLYNIQGINKVVGNNLNSSIILIEGVSYLTGQVLPISEIASMAHEYGIAIGLDLAHAIGNIPLSLSDWEIDFAVWCSYKYLNGGPGAMGGCYINRKYHNKELPRLSGWWASDITTRFGGFQDRELCPQRTIDGWQISTPSILSCAPLLASLEIFNSVDLGDIYAKSYTLTNYLWYLVNAKLDDKLFKVITPFHIQKQGAQLSLAVLNIDLYTKIYNILKNESNIVFDFRDPNIIRIAPVPLYNKYEDVWQLVDFLANLQNKFSGNNNE